MEHMKWEDLEPGDVLKINEEFESGVLYPKFDWISKYSNRELTVISVKKVLYGSRNDLLLVISYEKDTLGDLTTEFQIQLDGRFWSSLTSKEVFKIIKLAD